MSPAGTCSSGRPPRRPRQPRPRARRLLPADGRRRGPRRRHRPSLVLVAQAGSGLDRRAVRRALAARAASIARWVSLPAAEPAGRAALRPPTSRRSASTARRTWRFFETFVGPRGQRAAARQLPGRSQPGRRPSHVADEHRDVPAGDGDRPGLRLDRHARDGRAPRGDARHHRPRWNSSAATSTTGTTRATCAGSSPQYVSSVDSGNLAGHSSRSSNACRQMIDQPLPVEAALAGIDDAITLARERRGDIGDDRRSQTLTRRHLDEALELRREATSAAAATPEAWAARLAELTDAHPDACPTSPRRMTAERGEDRTSELVTWAEAAPADGEQPRPGPGAAAVAAAATDVPDASPSCPTADRSTTDGESRQPPQLAAACRRSPNRPTRCSRRWTSASCSIRPGSSSRSASGSGTATLDPSYYDLLASEARLASFLAIAKGDVDARPLVPARPGADTGGPRLRPDLVVGVDVRVPDAGARDARAGRSLLDQTYRLVVARQMRYAAERGVPWGISESAFNARDLEQTYQYSSFGVPGLGLKRGLSEDLVVAPYATALAAMIEPEAAVRNFARLGKAGAQRARTASARRSTTRRGGCRKAPRSRSCSSYMAHHQGMALVALGNVLNDRVDGRAVPRRPDRRGDRAAAPGAHAARRAGRAAARRGGARATPTCATSCRRSCAGSPRPTTRSRGPTCCRTAATQ